MVVVGGRVEEHLGFRKERAAVARHERHHRGQVAAGAVAEQHDAVGVGVVKELAGEQLARHLVAVVGRLGETVLGRATVVHRHHAPLQPKRHGGAGVQVKVHVSVDPAASVEEQDGAARLLAHFEALGQGEVDVERREHAQGHLVAVGHGGELLLDAAARVGDGELRQHVLGHTLRPVGRFDVGLEPRGRLERGEHRFVEGHGGPPFRKGAAAGPACRAADRVRRRSVNRSTGERCRGARGGKGAPGCCLREGPRGGGAEGRLADPAVSRVRAVFEGFRAEFRGALSRRLV